MKRVLATFTCLFLAGSVAAQTVSVGPIVTVPVPVIQGGTGVTSGGGQALDNILAPAGTGLVERTGANTYIQNATPLAVNKGGTGATTLPSGKVLLGNGTSAPTGVTEVDGQCLVGAAGVWVSASCSGGSVAFPTIFTQYSTPGTYTWNRNANTITADVCVVGGGGGSTNGAVGASVTGGNAGAPGALNCHTFTAAQLSTSQTVTVGDGGAAGSGADASAGQTSSLGTLIVAGGGGGGGAPGSSTTAHTGGTCTDSLGAGPNGTKTVSGACTQPSTTNAPSATAGFVGGSGGNTSQWPTPGGAGGPTGCGASSCNGGDGGTSTGCIGGAHGVAGTTGTVAGGSVPTLTNSTLPGCGGGGGGAATSGTGGAGAAGSANGGGAGGGGSSQSGSAGAGAKGGAGTVWIVEHP